MKYKYALTLLCALSLISLSLSAQYYYVPSLEPGNPGTLMADGEFPVGGGLSGDWTVIQGSSASPAWSPDQAIPFAFNFNGSPVTQYKASTTGVVTFDVAAGAAPSAANTSIPSAAIPDMSVMAWGLAATGTNDNVVSKTFGSAGSQQHWIFFTSMTTGASCWHYWAVVLEEGTDKIYIVDMRNNCNTALTVGIQIDSATAVSVLGSPALGAKSGTVADATDNYYYEFIPGVQPVNDMAGVAVTTDLYNVLDDAPFTISADLINLGSATVTSMDLNYSIDGGATFTESLTGLSIAPYFSSSLDHGTTWDPGAEGEFTVEVWASNINGSADEVMSNDKATGSAIVVGDFTDRVVLYETFTSSTCPPCTPANVTLEALFNDAVNDGKFASLKYQMSWPGAGDPYYTLEGGDRRNYYSVSSVPRLEVDGGWDQNAGSVTQGLMDDWSALPSFLELEAEYTITDSAFSVDVTMEPLTTYPAGNYVLHIAVFEYTTYNNIETNGETEFFHVMKKMLPDAGGSPLSPLISGEEQTASTTYVFNGEYRLPNSASDPINHATEHSVEEWADLGVIVWVQNDDTKEVLQAAEGELFVEPVSGIANLDILAAAKVYPNPVQERATVAFHLAGSTEDMIATVYDQLGQQVMVEHLGGFGPGRSTANLNTSDLSAGQYIVELRANSTATIAVRMTVVE